MSDNEETPIYDSIDTAEESTESENKTGWFAQNENRLWLYGIATAALALVAGYLGWDAAVQGNWQSLIGAIFSVGGGASTIMAARNVNK